MGYTTEFDGKITITPPLDQEEVAFLNAFSDSRRMDRKQGPYYVVGDENRQDIRDYNSPPAGQPGLWCQWIATEDGTAIVWDGGEKFYESEAWMAYIIEHFLGDTPKAMGEVSALKGGHKLNGLIHAQGEEEDDVWHLIVSNNVVQRGEGAPTAHALLAIAASQT